MPYRPRELVIRAREAAILLLRTIDRNETVERFLDLYAAQYRRPGRADYPALYREKLETIRREAILVMVLRIEAALPRRLDVSVKMRSTRRRTSRQGAKKKARRAKSAHFELAIPLLDLFREEFFIALGQALEWNEEDAREFWRDLELYEQLSRPASERANRRRPGLRGETQAASGPFVDRVGFLLDASLMDQARREAAKFQVELQGIAHHILAKTFMRRTL
jgi:hypothetical protein